MKVRTCIVTGASSFIGAHLTARLARDGHRVIGTHSRARGEYAGVRDERLVLAESAGAELATLDLLDPAAIERLVRDRRPDVWFHHAGWARSHGSHDYDLEAARRVDTQPLDTVFPALKESGGQGVVVTGSSSEYGARETPNTEDEPCWPVMPYGLSKLEATIRASQLARRYGVKARVARVFIPYGALDSPGKVVPAAVNALIRREALDLSPCTQRRDFLHVQDLMDGYVRLARSLDREEEFALYNLCSGVATPVRTLLLLLCRALDADPALLRFGAKPMRDGETEFSCGSPERARRDLGFAPRGIERGVADHVAEILRR